MELIRPRTIRARLRRILIVSVALVLALLTVIIAREVTGYRDTGDTAQSVQVALAVQDLVHEIQRERGLTNGLLGGDTAARPAVGNQRLATDFALQELNQALSGQPPGADLVHTALTQFSGVTANRADVDSGRADRTMSFTFYTNAIAALNSARPGMDHAQDSQLWRGLQSFYALGDLKEYTGQERGFLNGVFAEGAFGPGEYVKFLDIRAAKQAAATAFERDATAAQRSKLYALMQSDESVRSGQAEAVAIASERGTLTEPVNAGDWWREMSSVIDGERTVQRGIGAEITGRADELRRDAALVLAFYAVAAALAIAVEVWLVVATVRAIVRPLAELAEEADEVAGRRLPQLIADWQSSEGADPEPPEPVRADESAGAEIVSVAAALDRVQTTAYELASAQARLRRNTTESMANLARRNQNLVRRQLGLISEFEREELDPNALSNLFELDHLATRMRRNAESLLVLVGESSPRRWSKPIPLTDVIRAGLSEVDDYRRVVLRRVDDVAIAGAHVTEIAHMLAELIENGLSFSPPDLEVEIYGRRQGPRYTLAVVDHGVGMPPDQLAIANARLRGEADFLVAPTRFLGHFVVGRLARRLGIEIELTVSPTSGVVARMLLPAELLGDANAERPAPPEDAKHAAGAHLPTVVEAMPEPRPGRHSSPYRPTGSDAELPRHAVGAAVSPVSDTGAADFAADGERIGTPAAEAPAPTPDGRNGSLPAPATIKMHPLPEPADGREPPRTLTGLPAVSATDHGIRPVNGVSPSSGAAQGVSAAQVSVGSPVAEGEVSGAVPGVQRTRNGLVKRTRKTAGQTGVTPGGAQPETRPAAPPAADRSPDEVRSMLAGFRSGHQRGQGGQPLEPGPRA
ncbi:ATP-binding protein [Nocardia sp. ET3-3]|uniref:histidine kinase n=1 Tax=Nocardia terrae TaxID=2675851 RepID=A0A7K1UNZ8_9NOCA|nr:ATP-binding protein [Nocardia terrae]